MMVTLKEVIQSIGGNVRKINVRSQKRYAKMQRKKCLKGSIVLRALVCASLFFVGTTQADMEDFVSVPPLLSSTEDALVMLVMSNDNQLWHKAYTDYTDLDGDGTLDVSYNDEFVYYGYFDSAYCYSYNSDMYVPDGKVVRSESEVTVANPEPDHKCTNAAGKWSGNFMNWLTMTRIDIIRKVLYGGYRITDTSSSTVLQRALLPDDNHSFVKVVRDSGIDGNISNYTPISSASTVSFCNVTDPDDTSSGSKTRNISVSDNPPKLKIAIGNYFTWSGSERELCLYHDEHASGGNAAQAFTPARPDPATITGISQVEFNVRIKKCVSGQDEVNCREYSDGGGTYYKPYGLLQTYGENGGLQFGLMTGSYNKNDEGGVLRKNISYMGGDSAVSSAEEVSMENGQFINQGSNDNGIINTLNRLRIQGWDYSTNFYDDCDTWGISISDFLNPPGNNRKCRDWGNPITEMYLEALRYYSGETTATSDFATDDSSIISGLGTVNWVDPMSSANACANCAIILLSTGLNNFDGDNLNSATDLPGLSSASDPAPSIGDPPLDPTIDSFTDAVGVAEGIAGNNYIVGNATSGGSANTCDTKTISNFSDAKGVCPEVPSLAGSYGLAGFASYAYKQDLRSLEGEQTVKTYTVALAESLPSLEIQATNSESVTVVPYCIAEHGGVWQDCSLVDLTVMKLTDEHGIFYISWEDSLWGSDFDMDAYAVLEYCSATGTAAQLAVACPSFTTDYYRQWNNWWNRWENETPQPSWSDSSTGEIQFRVAVVGEASGVPMKFGYVMNGANNNGTFPDLEMGSGNGNFNSVALTGTDTNVTLWSPTARKFTAVSGSPGVLENPLWYAAKYGNFTDANDNGIPDLQSEWDKKDIEGNAGADGIPDGYFPVRNPAYLEKSLAQVFSDITTRVSSGTAASVVASTGAGEGAVYQALYNPVYEVDSITGNTEVNWVGTLHALFIDRNSELREDSFVAGGSDGILTSSDPIVDIYYDDTLGQTMVQRYLVDTDGTRGAANGNPFGIDDLQPIWSARDQLAQVSNYTSNRSYSASGATGRYIFTGIDSEDSRDGIIQNNEVMPFESDTFNTDIAGEDTFELLDVGDDEDDVKNLVNFIRGDETISGFRSRSIDYDGDSSNGDEPWLLGDIVNSSPVTLSRPNNGYEIEFGDSTYREYKNAKAGRRQVVFLGANDGMVHAFNAGFYSASDGGYKTSMAGETAHPLGSELWAYVPYNLLPHLQYLSRTDYNHVYYVDGQPQIFDVNGIWDSNSTIEHPGGWGTILVVGMRFGGGQVTVEVDGDDVPLRSGYVVLDITDPEAPPEVIAEITDEDLGYSVSIPTLVKFREKNSVTGSYENPAKNDWFLVFGSGPAGNDGSSRATALKDAVSSKTAKIFSFDLARRTLTKFDTSLPNAFIGGVQAADWNADFEDDAVYFGVVSGTEAAPTGQLMRGALGLLSGNLSMSLSKVLDVTNKPFSAQPSVVKDRTNNYWVFSGSGRYYTSGDNSSVSTQTFYGVKDPDATMASLPGTVVASADLVDTTSLDVYADGTVVSGSTTPVTLNTGETVGEFSEVKNAVISHSGWYFDLPYTRERSSTKAVLSGESLVFTTYQPTGEVCSAEGNGFLYAPNYQSGIAAPYSALGRDNNVVHNSQELVLRSKNLGVGNPSTPTIYYDSRGRSHAIIQTSTGEIINEEIGGRTRTGKRQSWREIPIDW